jgi:hypothetical protein
MAVALAMILPGVVGEWADRRFGTEFLVIVGFAIGLVAGMGSLLVMTRAAGKSRGNNHQQDGPT